MSMAPRNSDELARAQRAVSHARAQIRDLRAELDAARALLAGFPEGWTAEDERKRLEYDGERTRALLAARARIAELEDEVRAVSDRAFWEGHRFAQGGAGLPAPVEDQRR